MNEICKICGNRKENKIYWINERVFNSGKRFAYLKCDKCKTLMLNDEETIQNISEWYPKDYNPFHKEILSHEDWKYKMYRKIWTEIIIQIQNPKCFEKILREVKVDKLFKRLFGTRLKKKGSLLDVGCANGHWLYQMYEMGWHDITGVDLFCPSTLPEKRKWNFIKGTIFDIKDKKFDCITLNHSFEHMENPNAVLKKIYELLKKDGICVISIPLSDGISWEMFGTNYCQIDAPRHFYLYTVKAMQYLSKKNNLVIEKVIYDGGYGISCISEGYRDTNKSHEELLKYYKVSERRQKKYKEITRNANKNKRGDEAVFYLKKEIKIATEYC